MELEALKRSLNQLVQDGLQVQKLITNQHLQIQKFMREEQGQINHQLDRWHIAKGILYSSYCIPGYPSGRCLLLSGIGISFTTSWRSGKRPRLRVRRVKVRFSLRAIILSLENLNVIIRAIN